jgi:NADP-dependent 3-hydroxy acid dehydrogenase YdfG
LSGAQQTSNAPQPGDTADTIAFMVTRPRRSSIAELWTIPTSQA